ncbi:MAG: ATP-binding protein [Polyangiaceae bacterium]
MADLDFDDPLPLPQGTPSASQALDALPDEALLETPQLQELVSRQTLNELARSILLLFGIPVRVFSTDGALLAEAVIEFALYRYLEQFPQGKSMNAASVAAVKRIRPESGDVDFPCFTGASYRVIGIEYDRRPVGRIILGPYLPADSRDLPPSLRAIEGIDPVEVDTLRRKLPRAGSDTINRISTHLRSCLDAVLFSGHRAVMTSRMHLASIRESYRELQEKNERLQETFDKLRELDRLKSNFLATVSHELRTPLTSIIGYSEMLIEGIAGDLEGEQKEFVSTIRDKGEQLLQLIMSLLDMSKLESGTLSFRRGEMPVQRMLQQVASTMLPAARRKGVTLEVKVDEQLPSMAADEERLKQVFINLTENAIKFTPQSGVVTLRARRAEPDDGEGFALLAPVEDSIEISVTDTGIGIPESERSKVFDAFYQVDSSSTREHGGAGLGLAIVKKIVEAHHGEIKIEANSPSGTRVVVTLPIAPP